MSGIRVVRVRGSGERRGRKRGPSVRMIKKHMYDSGTDKVLLDSSY